MRCSANIAALLVLAAGLAGCGGTSEEQPAEQPTSAAAAEPPAASPAVAAAVQPPAFAQCRSCHSVEPGKNGIGPTLHGIVGSKAGEVPGFAFSTPLKQSGITWDRATLDQWLAGPMKMVPGTRMVIAVTDPARRKEIIDYLETLK